MSQSDGLDLTEYDNAEEIADGDPIVVMAEWDTDHHTETMTLGTGFDGTDDLAAQLEFAAENGTRTQNITDATARILRDADYIHIFSLHSMLTLE